MQTLDSMCKKIDMKHFPNDLHCMFYLARHYIFHVNNIVDKFVK